MVIEIKNVAWHAKIKSAWHNGAYASLEVCVCDPVSPVQSRSCWHHYIPTKVLTGGIVLPNIVWSYFLIVQLQSTNLCLI